MIVKLEFIRQVSTEHEFIQIKKNKKFSLPVKNSILNSFAFFIIIEMKLVWFNFFLFWSFKS